jgi:hypothetical protein
MNSFRFAGICLLPAAYHTANRHTRSRCPRLHRFGTLALAGVTLPSTSE